MRMLVVMYTMYTNYHGVREDSEQSAPQPARGRVTFSSLGFHFTVILLINSMGNLREKFGVSILDWCCTCSILCSAPRVRAHTSDSQTT
jgi:hypothetical protein